MPIHVSLFTFPSAAKFDIRYLDYAYQKRYFKVDEEFTKTFNLESKDYSTKKNKLQMCQFLGLISYNGDSFFITNSGLKYYDSNFSPVIFIEETLKTTLPYSDSQTYNLKDTKYKFFELLYSVFEYFYEHEFIIKSVPFEYVFCSLLNDDNYKSKDKIINLLFNNRNLTLNDIGKARCTSDYLLSSLVDFGFLKRVHNGFVVTKYFYKNYHLAINKGESDMKQEIKGYNKIFYGAPGCGKSYFVAKKLLPELGISNLFIRTTFYQDYTNSEFVGQILPRIKNGDVSYEFNPGPFTIALEMALRNSKQPVALIIEEINRGNAPSIFGDIFQLLDREDNGESTYEITNKNIIDYLNSAFGLKDKNLIKSIKIPSNLYLIGTMNTSDQNVFTLDTAFKRRWKFEKLSNNFNSTHDYQDWYVPGMGNDNITWKDMVLSINEYIITNSGMFMNEDKQIGIYFMNKENLAEHKIDASNDDLLKEFSYKMLEYLWDDVAKMSRADLFDDPKSLDKLIADYKTKGIKVFKDGIIKKH